MINSRYSVSALCYHLFFMNLYCGTSRVCCAPVVPNHTSDGHRKSSRLERSPTWPSSFGMWREQWWAIHPGSSVHSDFCLLDLFNGMCHFWSTRLCILYIMQTLFFNNFESSVKHKQKAVRGASTEAFIMQQLSAWSSMMPVQPAGVRPGLFRRMFYILIHACHLSR